MLSYCFSRRLDTASSLRARRRASQTAHEVLTVIQRIGDDTKADDVIGSVIRAYLHELPTETERRRLSHLQQSYAGRGDAS